MLVSPFPLSSLFFFCVFRERGEEGKKREGKGGGEEGEGAFVFIEGGVEERGCERGVGGEWGRGGSEGLCLHYRQICMGNCVILGGEKERRGGERRGRG